MARVTSVYWYQVGSWATNLLFKEKLVVRRHHSIQVRLLKQDLMDWLRLNAGVSSDEITLQQVHDPDNIIFIIKIKN